MPGDQPEEKTRAHDVLVTICAAVWRAAAPGRGAAACRRPRAQTSRPPGRRQRDGRRSWVHVGVSTMLGHLRVRHLPLGTTLLADIEPRGQGAHLGRRLRGSAVDLVAWLFPPRNGPPQMVPRLAAVLAASACSVLAAGSASASPPDHFVQSSNESFEFTVDCGTFEAHVAGTVSDRFTVFFDSAGNVTRFTEFVSAPRDVWTNMESGESIVVRGHFVQVHNRVPGTDEFDRTVTGFRYLVNEPGERRDHQGRRSHRLRGPERAQRGATSRDGTTSPMDRSSRQPCARPSPDPPSVAPPAPPGARDALRSHLLLPFVRRVPAGGEERRVDLSCHATWPVRLQTRGFAAASSS